MAEAFLSRSTLGPMQREPEWSKKERRWIHEVECDGVGGVTPLLPRRLSWCDFHCASQRNQRCPSMRAVICKLLWEREIHL
jgi:hypothetical protein